jgi:hypothetical protein
VTAVEELAVDEPPPAPGAAAPAIGGAFGGSAATELPLVGTLEFGLEEPQPAASVTARSSATTVTPAAQFGLRDPDIRRLWARKRPYSGPQRTWSGRLARHDRLLRRQEFEPGMVGTRAA